MVIMKFMFTSQFQGFGSPKNTLEFECDDIADVVMYFEQFLRGAGYHFDGHLDLCNITEPVRENWNEPEQETECVEEPLYHLHKRCNVCGLTAKQLGNHTCYDSKCGMK